MARRSGGCLWEAMPPPPYQVMHRSGDGIEVAADCAACGLPGDLLRGYRFDSEGQLRLGSR